MAILRTLHNCDVFRVLMSTRFPKTRYCRHSNNFLNLTGFWLIVLLLTSGFAASLRPAFGRPAGLRPACERLYILAASPRRAAGLRPDFQRFYILAASPLRSAGLRPDCQRFRPAGRPSAGLSKFYILGASPFYILAASPHHAAGLKTSEIKCLGGGFRCSSKKPRRLSVWAAVSVAARKFTLKINISWPAMQAPTAHDFKHNLNDGEISSQCHLNSP